MVAFSADIESKSGYHRSWDLMPANVRRDSGPWCRIQAWLLRVLRFCAY